MQPSYTSSGQCCRLRVHVSRHGVSHHNREHDIKTTLVMNRSYGQAVLMVWIQSHFGRKRKLCISAALSLCITEVQWKVLNTGQWVGQSRADAQFLFSVLVVGNGTWKTAWSHCTLHARNRFLASLKGGFLLFFTASTSVTRFLDDHKALSFYYDGVIFFPLPQ